MTHFNINNKAKIKYNKQLIALEGVCLPPASYVGEKVERQNNKDRFTITMCSYQNK